MPESVPDAAPPDCPTNARSITDPISVACSATPNPPLAAMIRIITPALINDVSTIPARSARLTLRCRAYTHRAIPVPSSRARLGFPITAVYGASPDHLATCHPGRHVPDTTTVCHV